MSSSSLDLLKRSLPKDARVVITGATGWLGRSLAIMLQELGTPTLLLGSRARTTVVDQIKREIFTYSDKLLDDFSPNVLVDFAFLTREHISELGLEQFTGVNLKLIGDAISIASRPGLNHVILCSSGAAVHPKDAALGFLEENPYGYLKMQTEYQAAELANKHPEKRVVVLRPWSLSGAHVTKVDGFAFSSFVAQALHGEIKVRSKRPVFRRYISVEDFLAVGLACLFTSAWKPLIVDSGGELTSAVELAALTASRVSPKALVVHDVDTSLAPDDYYSDNSSWLRACELLSFAPENLVQQVDRVIASLSSRLN